MAGRDREQRRKGVRGREQERAERKQRRRVLTAGNFFLAFIGTLFIFCTSVYLVLNLRPIYYLDIHFLKIEQNVGLDGREIRENYDTLVDYNLVTKQVGELKLPSFPMSETGKIHFEEVRRIFFAIQYAGFACLLLFAAGFVRKLHRRDFGCLRLMSFFTMAVPVLLGVLAALDWQTFFIKFHELFFQNDYWLFDPAADPVILILPDEFFLHCAAAVLLFIFLGSMASGALYRLLAGKAARTRRRI